MLPKFTLRDAIFTAFIFITFGIYVPYRSGIDFFDTLLLVPYACVSFLFCAPLVIDSIYAQGRTGVTLRQLARGIGYGWCCGALIVTTGIVTVNLTAGMPRTVLPPAAVLLCALVISFLGCGFVAGLAAELSVREDNPMDAKRKIRIGFLLSLCAVWFIPGWLPLEWQDWVALQSTSDNLARNTLLLSPLMVLADILIFMRVIGREHQGERNRLAIR